MSTIRVNQVQDTSTNVAANISGGVVTFNNSPLGLLKTSYVFVYAQGASGYVTGTDRD
jgi:hypothetical protein